MDLNLDALYAFTVFSETRNFTRAAETLHISQPALHVKIKKLSEELGVPIYTKSGRELVLTSYGKALVRTSSLIVLCYKHLYYAPVAKEHTVHRDTEPY